MTEDLGHAVSERLERIERILVDALHHALLAEERGKHLTKQGVHMMSQLDDLMKALGTVSDGVVALGPLVAGLAAEVQDLIIKLQNLPPSTDLTAAIAQAQEIGSRVATVAAVAAQVQAIPPEPTQA